MSEAKPYSEAEIKFLHDMERVRVATGNVSDSDWHNTMRWIATVDALRARVESLTAERDAATARAEMAVGLLSEVKEWKYVPLCRGPRSDGPCDCLTALVDALLASGGAGGGE